MWSRMFVVLALLCLVFVSGVESSIRVACVGDSITEGGGCLAESYVSLLANQLGSRFEVLNTGVSGRTMLKNGLLESGEAFSYWDTSAWKKTLTSDPQIVTILLGTNDAKTLNWEGIQQNTGDYFALDYVDMIHTLRQQTNVKEIFIGIPPPLYAPFPFTMNQTIINTIYPTLLPNIARVANVQLVDVFTPLSGKDMTCDGCHPTHDGNVLIANAFYEAIVKHSSYFQNKK